MTKRVVGRLQEEATRIPLEVRQSNVWISAVLCSYALHSSSHSLLWANGTRQKRQKRKKETMMTSKIPSHVVGRRSDSPCSGARPPSLPDELSARLTDTRGQYCRRKTIIMSRRQDVSALTSDRKSPYPQRDGTMILAEYKNKSRIRDQDAGPTSRRSGGGRGPPYRLLRGNGRQKAKTLSLSFITRTTNFLGSQS